MTITALDPRTALVVIDLQKGIVGLPVVHPVDDIVRRSADLAAAFRARGLPVVLVNVAGAPPGRTARSGGAAREFPSDWTDLVPELDQQPDDLLVTKRTRGAFTNTGLQQQLEDRGVTQVVVTGIATSIGVESTARDAHERSFNVVLATDATTDLDRDAHDHSLAHVFPRIAELASTDEILGLVAGD
jgi:nicotinamidase-related amidase